MWEGILRAKGTAEEVSVTFPNTPPSPPPRPPTTLQTLLSQHGDKCFDICTTETLNPQILPAMPPKVQLRTYCKEIPP